MPHKNHYSKIKAILFFTDNLIINKIKGCIVMLNRNNKGNSLPQYIIIIALIALALTPVFIFLGNYLFQYFDSLKNSFTNNNAQIQTNSVSKTNNVPVNTETPAVNTVTSGTLGGTITKPVKQCTNGKCDIDFGNFVLQGIPENFQEAVVSGGASGGTETIKALLMQISLQLEEKGLNAESEDIKNLANLGHELAGMEKAVENLELQCNYDKDCIKNANETKLDPSICKYLPKCTYKNLFNTLDADFILANSEDTNDPETPAVYEYVNITDKIKNNNNIDNNVKGIIELLSANIRQISQDVHELGHMSDPVYYDSNLTLQDYNASKLTNLDAGLICASGNYEDVQNKCVNSTP
jgi:hypothetical protein